MVNRYFNPTPYEGKLYAPPVDFIAGALEKLQGVYDKNYETAQNLKDTYLESLPQDRSRADVFQNEIIQSIDNITSKYSGDYSQATKDLITLQNDIKRKLRPGTEFYTIGKNFQTYNEALKREQERLAKKEINEMQYSALVNNINNSYKGVQKDPTTGTYNPLVISPLATYVNANQKASDVLDKLKPREVQVEDYVKDPATGMIKTIKRTQSAIDPNEAAAAVQNALLNDDQFMSYHTQLARLQGKDPQQELRTLVSDINSQLVPVKSGIFKDLTDIELREDPIARDARAYNRAVQLENLRLNNNIRFEQYKERQAVEADGGDVDILGRVRQGKQYPALNAEPGSMRAIPSMGLVGVKTPGLNVDQMLKNQTRNDVNYPLLEELRRANPNLSSRDIIQLYNDNVSKDNYSTELYYTRYKTTAAQKEEAERLLPLLESGTVPVHVYNPATGEVTSLGENPEDRKAVAAKLKKDGKLNARALGKTMVSSGDAPFGTILQPADSQLQYIIPETSTKYDEFNFGKFGDESSSRRYAMFGWQKKGTQGPVFTKTYELPDGQKTQVELMGVKRYRYDPRLKQAIPQTMYVGVTYGPDGKPRPNYNDPLVRTDPNTGEKYVLTPFDLEREEITPDMVYKTFPHRARSASKDSNNVIENF